MMSEDSEVEVIIDVLKENQAYVHALGIFSGKAHKAPGLEEKRTMLLNIVKRPPEEYFLHGSRQFDDFKAIKAECYAGWNTSSRRAKLWTTTFTADKFARLLVLREQVDAKKKIRPQHPCQDTPTPPMNDLKRSLKNLFTAYDKCLVPYIEARRAKANKSVRLPSLDRQLTGPLRQYDFPFNNRKKDLDGCPLCLHLSTIAIRRKHQEPRSQEQGIGRWGRWYVHGSLGLARMLLLVEQLPWPRAGLRLLRVREEGG